MASPYSRAPKGSSPLPWILGLLGFLGLLGAVGVTILLLRSSSEPDEDPEVVAASPAPTPGVSSTPRAATSAAPLAAPTPKLKPSLPATRPVTSSTGAPTSVAAPEPPGSDASTPPVRPFDRGLAEARVDQVMATLSTCRRDGDPTGSSTVGITFENDGRVGTRMRRPFAGTPTGDCISQRFLALENAIPRFEGSAVTISRGFTIAP